MYSFLALEPLMATFRDPFDPIFQSIAPFALRQRENASFAVWNLGGITQTSFESPNDFVGVRLLPRQ